MRFTPAAAGLSRPGARRRREHRVLSVLHQRYRLAPRSLLLCEDESIIGAVFIVEERRRGFVIRDDIPAEFAKSQPNSTAPSALRWSMRLPIRDALIPPRWASTVSDGSKAISNAELSGWARRWKGAARRAAGSAIARRNGASAGHDTARSAERTRRWRCGLTISASTIVCSGRPTTGANRRGARWGYVHPRRPLADLGYVLNYWVELGDTIPPAARNPRRYGCSARGFPSRATAVERYAGFAYRR